MEEMKKVDQCHTEKICTLGNSETTIAIPGDRWWPQKAKQEGHKVSKNVCLIYEKT